MPLLAVDPGIRGCGVAIFDRHLLLCAAYVANGHTEDSGPYAASEMAAQVVDWVQCFERLSCVEYLAIEWPRIYASRIREGATKADPNDLLGLAAVGGALATYFQTTTHYAPSDWKGQLKKDPCQARILSRLDASELAVAEKGAKSAKSKAHNMWDAIGIGLYHLGRFDRKRVIP